MSDTESGSGPVIRDRRRLDPETGKVRDAYGVRNDDRDADAEPPSEQQTGRQADQPDQGEPDPAGRPAAQAGRHIDHEAVDPVGGPIVDPADVDKLEALAAERLADLLRLQAEFVNYRRRVERDRDVARDGAVASMLEALLPVLDDIHLARQHGDLDGGPFAAIAEKLEAVLGRFGLARYGEPGETFDPAVHEALIHTEAELAAGTTETTVVQVLQPGYRSGDRVLRAARVAVADPG